MRKTLTLLALAAAIGVGSARVTTVDTIAANPGKAGGVYFAYPVASDADAVFTPAPKGYKPFYVSHYGRHGSRYLISDDDYRRVIDRLAHADAHNALTPLGKDVKKRMDTIYAEARGRGGELTPLGARQHRAIARRLISRYPDIFAGTPQITAASTTVMRCAHSMFAFAEGLKEVNPSLDIPRESSNRNMFYLNYHSPESGKYSGHDGAWYGEWKKFRAEKTHPDRIIGSLFSDSLYVRRYVNPVETMWDLYWVTVDLQNMETPVRMYDIFTADELFDLWQVFNFNFYGANSSYPLADGQLTDNAKNLTRNILETADSYIAEGKNGATLRFGHDGNIIPLAALLQLDDCVAYQASPGKLADEYADYAISPMASNIQMIFFRNAKTGDIIVKILLNEREIAIADVPTDIFPYYRWDELRQWLVKVIETPSRNFIPASAIK